MLWSELGLPFGPPPPGDIEISRVVYDSRQAGLLAISSRGRVWPICPWGRFAANAARLAFSTMAHWVLAIGPLGQVPVLTTTSRKRLCLSPPHAARHTAATPMHAAGAGPGHRSE
jgi:hypothetical protein